MKWILRSCHELGMTGRSSVSVAEYCRLGLPRCRKEREDKIEDQNSAVYQLGKAET